MRKKPKTIVRNARSAEISAPHIQDILNIGDIALFARR